ncbi:Conserved_hypothetical protein [Hexamita inflata]|uniref:Transmembrane protein n=1 Tax=Hexamita inflata TaxID=28002 RepID=A0AA86UNF1_9EUKA|nr:Conserved hypothetical protein [Hexamita inflata]
MFILSLQAGTSTFKQCFSPASSIQGNRLTRRMTLTLQPNSLMNLIPSDNMCNVLNNKQSVAQIQLFSQVNGIITLPNIPFTYQFNKSISLTYQFPSMVDYDKTLDVTNAGYSVLLDNEYQITGSVASIYHVRSNQTSCFSSSSFIYAYMAQIFMFEVQPVFCDVVNFTPFMEFLIDGVWEEIEIQPLEIGSTYNDGQSYAKDITEFQNIKYYIIDTASNTEKIKYSDIDKQKILKVEQYYSQHKNLKVRLSLRYKVGPAIAAITNIADYKFSADILNCYDETKARASLNEDNIMIKSGLRQQLQCINQSNTNVYYDYSQYVLRQMSKIQIDIIIYTNTKDYEYSQVVSIDKFLALPYSKFIIDNASIRELMDYNDTVENKIQVFYEIQDKDGKYLYDFNTKYMDLMRTCIKKRVVHYYKNQTQIAVWAKSDYRCKQRTNISQIVRFRGYTLENDGSYKIRQSQDLRVIQNFAIPVTILSVTCANDLFQSQEDCQKNRQIMLSKENRKEMVYNLESKMEYNEIIYYSIEYANVVWKWIGVVAGCLITVFIVVGGTVLTKQMSV